MKNILFTFYKERLLKNNYEYLYKCLSIYIYYIFKHISKKSAKKLKLMKLTIVFKPYSQDSIKY